MKDKLLFEDYGFFLLVLTVAMLIGVFGIGIGELKNLPKIEAQQCQIECMDKLGAEYSIVSSKFTNETWTRAHLNEDCTTENEFGQKENPTLYSCLYHSRHSDPEIINRASCFCGFEEELNNSKEMSGKFWIPANGGWDR